MTYQEAKQLIITAHTSLAACIILITITNLIKNIYPNLYNAIDFFLILVCFASALYAVSFMFLLFMNGLSVFHTVLNELSGRIEKISR